MWAGTMSRGIHKLTALGVAKVVLGWPAYLVAITAMGAILMRGRTPIDPSRLA